MEQSNVVAPAIGKSSWGKKNVNVDVIFHSAW